MKFAAQNGNSKRGAKVGNLIMNSECRNEFNTEGAAGTEDTEKITNYEKITTEHTKNTERSSPNKTKWTNDALRRRVNGTNGDNSEL